MKLKTILLGAASALVALPAFGADQNITTTVTSPVSTSVQSGNITISSTGSVAVTGQTIPDGETFPTAAVTIDSNHSVTNAGTISAKAADTPVAVELVGGNTGNFTNSGIIRAEGETVALTSTEGVGVLVNGAGNFVGDIVMSAGSQVTATGATARGISILTGLDGDLVLDGSVKGIGAGSNAVDTAATITGSITNGGELSTDSGDTGTLAAPTSPGSALRIGGSVLGGIENEATGTISTLGSSPAVRIAPVTAFDADVHIGEFMPSGYSFINRGDIVGQAIWPNTSTTAVQIGGNTSYDTILDQGFYNSGLVSAMATSDNDKATNSAEAPSNATALFLAANAQVPDLVNDTDGVIEAETGGPAGGNATGIDIATTASLPIITNNGTISALSATTNDDLGGLFAYAIRDRSGTLTSITNSGTISAVAGGSSGRAFAADLRNASTAVTFANTGTVVGDIHFGTSFDSLFTVEGADASFEGFIESGGKVDVRVSAGSTGGTMVTRGVRNAGEFTVGDNGVLEIEIAQSTDPIITAREAANFATPSSLYLTPTSFLVDGQYELVTSDVSIAFGDFAGTTSTADIPFLFNGSLTTDANSLYLNLDRKTVGELGLTGNSARIYDALAAAALEDDDLGVGLLALNSNDEVQDALAQFVPYDGSVSKAVAAMITDPMGGNVATRQRKLLVHRDALGQGGVWVQGSYSMFDNSGANGYDGNGGGGSIGLDWGEADAGHFGLAYNFFHGNADGTGVTARDMRIDWNILTFYLGFNEGPIFVNAQFNAGLADVEGKRHVSVGAVSRTSETRDWTETLGSGGVSAGYLVDLGDFHLAPTVGIDYMTISRSTYSESGGGAGVDLKIRDAFDDTLRGFAGLEFGGEVPTGGVTLLPQGHVGVQHNFIDDPEGVVSEFLSVPGSSFTTFGPGTDATAFVGGVGVDVSMGWWTAGVHYNTIIRSDTTTHTAGANVSARF